jgi:hypothetical protein
MKRKKRNTASTDRSKNRITNKKECEIATYKTRAEIIAQNPVREGDEDYLRSARVCAILGISSTTLSRWNTEKPPRIPFKYAYYLESELAKNGRGANC